MAKTPFAQLRSLWISKNIRRKTKLSLFETTVKSVLLLGYEPEGDKGSESKPQVFVNGCRRRILNEFLMWICGVDDIKKKYGIANENTKIQVVGIA